MIADLAALPCHARPHRGTLKDPPAAGCESLFDADNTVCISWRYQAGGFLGPAATSHHFASLWALGTGIWATARPKNANVKPKEGDLYDLEGGIGVLDVARHEKHAQMCLDSCHYLPCP
jgi:hypothetical protein